MTPQERQLVDELFDRLVRLENAPRDAEAQRAISEGLARRRTRSIRSCRRCSSRMRRSNARMRASANSQAKIPPRHRAGGFLDSMRQVLTGHAGGTSVPSVRPGTSAGPDPRWNNGSTFAQPAAAQPAPSSGGSFLGTAAASAAGVIGGALLLNSISSMFGNHGSRAFAADPSASGSPWDNNSAAGSDLARDAGLKDIGGDTRGDARAASLFDDDSSSESVDLDDDFDSGVNSGGDFGGDSA